MPNSTASNPMSPKPHHATPSDALPGLIGTLGGVTVAVPGSLVAYGLLRRMVGQRLDPEAEFTGADLGIHKVSATAERETNW